MTRLRVRAAAATHPGCVRASNEDAILARDTAGLWAVADGMGGHANGEWASATLIDALAALGPGEGDAAPRLIAALQAGNGAIVRAATSLGAKMGTTVVVLHLAGDAVTGLWVGDSRIYRMRGGTLTQLTRDHSVVQEMVDRGQLTAAEAEDHPMAHVLNRAVGIEESLAWDGFEDRAQPGDSYLLCSDGLTKVLADAAIAARLAGGSPARAVEALVADTLAAGAPDNVSVIIVALEETTAIAPARVPA